MPKYIIEREIPGAGNLPAADLQANVISRVRAVIDPTTAE